MNPFPRRLASTFQRTLSTCWTSSPPRSSQAFRHELLGAHGVFRANSSNSSKPQQSSPPQSSPPQSSPPHSSPPHSSPPEPPRDPRVLQFKYALTAAGVGIAAAIISTVIYDRTAEAEAPPDPDTDASDDVPTFRLSEVQKHNGNSETPWVIRGNRVYDVTDWIPAHPGGKVALRAAGGTLEPFWKIFSIHNKPEVIDILEHYFIGVVDPVDLVDGAVPQDAIEDLFINDPARDERLMQHTSRPCNAETPACELSDYITPNNIFYVRNHMWVPELTEDEFELTIELFDGTEVVYTMEELKKKFTPYTVTAVLQCSGNRRSHMTKWTRKTNGLQWDVGAIGNAEWTGAKMRDVLKDAGMDVDELDDDLKHAQFMGLEGYGGSIPIEKAVDRRGDVLLAYEMNGQTLPRDHGYPLRVVVPGHVAARSVKWVKKITMAKEESTSQWQRRDYKCFGPNETGKEDWEKAASIQEMPVQSAVTSIKEVNCHDSISDDDKSLLEAYGLKEDCVRVEGYAFAGGGRRIVRVDVSADGGQTWNQAELLNGADSKGSKAWGWQRWRFGIAPKQCGQWFMVKAIDEGYNTQPSEFASHYNGRGNLVSGWHRALYKDAETPDAQL